MAVKKEKKISTIEALRAKYGRPDTEFVDTRIPQLNDIWGGGLPTGKIVELHSDPGLGKTTLSIQIAMAYISAGKKVAFMDVEQALDESLKVAMGINKYESDNDPPTFLHLSPNSYSEVEETMDLIMHLKYDLVIYDSLTMTVTERRKEGSIVDVKPGDKAMMQSLFLEQYKAALARAGATLLIINQMRTKISFIRTTNEPAGGKALQFDTDIRTGMRRIRNLESGTGEDKTIKGVELELITIKNKLTHPFRAVRCQLIFGKGVDSVASLAQVLLDRGVVEQKAASFILPGDHKNVKGREAYQDWVKVNLPLIKDLLGGDTSELVNEGIDENHTQAM